MGITKKAGLLPSLLIAVFAAATVLPATAQTPAPPAKAPVATTQKSPITDPNALKCANGVCLAYIASTSAQANDDAQKGLEALQATLAKKTSVHPEAVVALNVEQADLSLFRFIYWPITPNTQPLSDNARKKVQDYINSGGVLLFDTMGQANTETLRKVLGEINVRPLTNLDKDHTLKKAFYKITSLPGSTDYNNVWVEAPGAQGSENVSSVIIGDNNWAGAWAGRTLPQTSHEREIALRAGVNMVLYSLAGNFKADPIQVTLEKLGKE